MSASAEGVPQDPWRRFQPAAAFSLGALLLTMLLAASEGPRAERLRQRCEELRAEAARLRDLSQKRPQLIRDMASIEEQSATLARMLPSDAEAVQRELERKLVGLGYRLSHLEPLPPDRREDSTWIRHRVRLAPGGRTWLESLDDMAMHLPIVSIDELAIDDPRNPESELELVLSVRLLR